MITKELLSEVLGVKIKDIYKIGSNPNFDNSTLPYSIIGSGDLEIINIYELAHKCKEWAEYNGWFLYPCRNFESTYKKFGCSIMKPRYSSGQFSWLLSRDGYDEREYLADTETESILKTCQWILENKDK